MWLELSGVITETAGATAAYARNPGTLCDIRVELNQQFDLAAGHWYTWSHERAILSGVLPAETAADVTADADSIRSVIYVPFAYPWLARPADTLLDMADEVRLDVHVAWQDDDALLSGGTHSFTTAPTVDVILETSDEAPAGSARGYVVQREVEASGLGTTANDDRNIVLPYGPSHTYVGMVLSGMDVDASVGRKLVSTSLSQIRLEVNGSPGPNTAINASGTELQDAHRYLARDFDAVQTGIYPLPLLAGSAGGMLSQAVGTSDASDVRLRINHSAFSTDGVILVAYDEYRPK